MEYMTCLEAHELWGITPRRIQQMCKNGDIEGAVKKGKSWMIPRNAVSPSADQNKTAIVNPAKKKPLPIGVADFKKATSDYYYVDKTLLIRDFIDTKSEVTLFTRPRRFGKTLNMDCVSRQKGGYQTKISLLIEEHEKKIKEQEWWNFVIILSF